MSHPGLIIGGVVIYLALITAAIIYIIITEKR